MVQEEVNGEADFQQSLFVESATALGSLVVEVTHSLDIIMSSVTVSAP